MQTRAERDGSEWVVNGQKVWTTNGFEADYGLLIARSDWDVPKHRGITFFFFPMKQPGVEVRPLRQITGGAQFNEVFITDARVPDANVVGGVGEGWRVLQTALAVERQLMGSLSASASEIAGGSQGSRRPRPEPEDESSAVFVEGGASPVELARQWGLAGDPVVRQAIARLYTLRAVNRWNAIRARDEARKGTSSSVASIGKLAMSEILHSSARLNASILGASALLTGPDSGDADEVNLAMLTAYVNSIGGGTDQIQRNILGERVLGLPKEPDVDRDIAFRDVRKAEATRRLGA